MWGNQTWFWAYYNVKSITIDTNPAHVKTNMHSGEFKALDKISTLVELYWEDNNDPRLTGKDEHEFKAFNILPYNDDDRNSDLLAYMEANKDMFGTILYEDNGDNVTDFDLIVPVKIVYEWGEFETSLKLRIERTAGH